MPYGLLGNVTAKVNEDAVSSISFGIKFNTEISLSFEI
jgi:hypothetical protein